MTYSRLLKSEDDYEAALARIDEIFDAKEGSAEADERDLLVALVEIYEAKNYPISSPDPLSAIKFRMEQAGLTKEDMAQYLGSKSRVSEGFSGKRKLSIAMIRKLTSGLHIPAEVLIQEF